jgi:hypothetical protein
MIRESFASNQCRPEVLSGSNETNGDRDREMVRLNETNGDHDRGHERN